VRSRGGGNLRQTVRTEVNLGAQVLRCVSSEESLDWRRCFSKGRVVLPCRRAAKKTDNEINEVTRLYFG
jgi:hypothetical protein